MSNNTNDYPSCIKIPNAKPDHKTIQHQIKDNLPLVTQLQRIKCVNDALLSAANEIFGEEKWSYSVCNQTLDFVDSAWGVYIVGCHTIIKIELSSGIYHEDMGYSIKEGPVKGEAIHCARIVSKNIC
ncbi:PREDICTED: DNA repair protein RAD52 homolog [Polistes dominula]|uniref:DNA repair protein RAD52 homolog n=1 Tax=Polistes dominula TaxID=743375 RepID=A0ABM1J6N0_POLDO|nr:PREDICTED: DNA repair protein RAD52 homolog [Polistes dominula]